MNHTYIGEHLIPGQIGQFFVVLSFTSALLAFVSYVFSSNHPEEKSWQKLARISFFINASSVIGIGVALFYIISHHYFEYHYAWAHSSKELPIHYMISCYWEGQEGSFWLWAFWQAMIGLFLIWKSKTWESPIMSVVSLSQVFLASMLLGLELLGQKIGSSPFVLLREASEGPIFSRSDYLSLITDGNGLNPLLQNYWMVIHPPTLFLGFASMVVPFAYCLAGLWKNKIIEWMTPALPWALFALLVLGAGIIMGSFWAYEALNFGGFWSWDPVENASLFPWILLLAALHLIIVFEKTGQAYFSAVICTLLSFILVLYATFLTRSGILGNSSVHSFTDLGMSGQLLIYILFFIGLSIVLLIIRRRSFPVSAHEEEIYSREFWMFVGSLVMSVACLQILATTSIPVYNKLFNTSLAPPTDVIKHYNRWQMPFAMLIMLVSGFTLHLKFKKTSPESFYGKVGRIALIATILTAGFVWITTTYTHPMYILLVYASLFSVLANGVVMVSAFQRKISGAAVSHIGFSIMLLGALVSAATNKVISINETGIGFGSNFDKNNNSKENLLLYRNEPVQMGKYKITYLGDSTSSPNTFYKVLYQVFDENNTLQEAFVLMPNAQVNPKMGLIASPDTRHYLLHDIYNHVSMVPLKKEGEDENGKYDPAQKFEVSAGDTIRLSDKYIIVKAINKNPNIQNLPLQSADLAVGMDLEIFAFNKTYSAQPIFLIRGNNTFDFGKTIDDIGMKLNFTNVLPQKNKLELSIRQKKATEKDYIVLRAVAFPYINLLWAGAIVMTLGFGIAIYNRWRKSLL